MDNITTHHFVYIEGEDINSVILHAFHLLDDSKNIIVEGSQVTDDTNIRVNDHADNVMTLSYYTNQVIYISNCLATMHGINEILDCRYIFT